MIIKKKNKKSAEGIEEQIVPQQEVESNQDDEKDIDLFSLDNIDFKQRQERG